MLSPNKSAARLLAPSPPPNPSCSRPWWGSYDTRIGCGPPLSSRSRNNRHEGPGKMDGAGYVSELGYPGYPTIIGFSRKNHQLVPDSVIIAKSKSLEIWIKTTLHDQLNQLFQLWSYQFSGHQWPQRWTNPSATSIRTVLNGLELVVASEVEPQHHGILQEQSFRKPLLKSKELGKVWIGADSNRFPRISSCFFSGETSQNGRRLRSWRNNAFGFHGLPSCHFPYPSHGNGGTFGIQGSTEDMTSEKNMPNW